MRLIPSPATGYYVRPRDGSHFVKLFADAQFYSCMLFLLVFVRRCILIYSPSASTNIPTLRIRNLHSNWRSTFPDSKGYLLWPWRLSEFLLSWICGFLCLSRRSFSRAGTQRTPSSTLNCSAHCDQPVRG